MGTWPRSCTRSGLGRLGADGEHVVVDPVALRALAGPAADDDWDEGFAGMCAYAAGKGWVEPDGGLVSRRVSAGLAELASPGSGTRRALERVADRGPAGASYP